MDIKDVKTGSNDKSVVINESKSPATEDKTAISKTEESPDSEDINDILELLNVLQTQTGGKERITDIPKPLRSSIRKMYEDLVFIRDLFEDPVWRDLLDDLKDQKEEGTMPSVEVAIARTIPLDKLQELSDTEDYASTQEELKQTLESKKQVEEDDLAMDANYNESRKAGEEYAKEMGYNEAETNELFQLVIDIFSVMADGKITKDEFAKVDKMRNYDRDIASLNSQINVQQDSKEVLPDQASIEATMGQPKQNKAATPPANAPGMGSMEAYMNPITDITQVKGQKRRMR